MRLPRLILAALAALVFATALAGAQSPPPFGGRGGTPAERAPERPPERPTAEAAGEPGLFARLRAQLIKAQRDVTERLAREVRAYKEQGTLGPAFAILLISFLYGVFHALGPGHGKMVTTSYFAANRARVAQGLTMSGMIAVIQAMSAIVIVGVLAVALEIGQRRTVAAVTYIEAASSALILGLGLWIAWGGVVGRGCRHDHGPVGHGPVGHGPGVPAHDHKHDHAHDHAHDHGHGHGTAPTASVGSMFSAALAAGIRPCTGAILVLLFTLSQGIFEIGVISAFVMSLGVFLVIAAIGVGTILVRRTVATTAKPSTAVANLAHRAAGIGGGLVIVGFGALLLSADLARLGISL
jgi:nickel/cobalt transporter (NicO) family protein